MKSFRSVAKWLTKSASIFCSILLFSGSLSQLAAGNPADRNSFKNGNFERPELKDFVIFKLRRSEVTHYQKNYTACDRQMVVERSRLKPRSGNYCLRLLSNFDDGWNRLYTYNLPVQSGVKYRFSFDYFISWKTGKNRLSTSVYFQDRNNKNLRVIYPEGAAAPGKWQRYCVNFIPPKNCCKLMLIISFIGRQEVFMDNLYCGKDTTPQLVAPHVDAGCLAKLPGLTIWKEAPYLKVKRSGLPPDLPQLAQVAVDMASNESEPFQLIVSPQKNYSKLHWEFSDLKSGAATIPAANITSREIGYIYLKKPNNPALKGWHADPILPNSCAAATAGQNLPFYISIRTAKQQPGGIYYGTFRLLDGTKVLGTWKLQVRVRNFALPDVAHLKNYFYALITPRTQYAKLDPRPLAEVSQNYLEIFQEHRFNGNQATRYPRIKLQIRNGQLKVLDWSLWDADVAHKASYGLVNFPVPLISNFWADVKGWCPWIPGAAEGQPRTPFGGYSWKSPEGLKYAQQFLRAFDQHAREKFPQLNFYAYLFSEIPESFFPEAQRIHDALHQAAPRVKIFASKLVNDQMGYVHTFNVPFAPGFYHPEKHQAHQKKGGEIWYYNWYGQIDDEEYIQSRLYPWQIYTADCDGVMLWDTTNIGKGLNPWNDLDRTFRGGLATLFYPPRHPGEGIRPSLRSLQMKEGIDDFDYLRILENRIDRYYPGQGKIRVKEIIREIIPDIPFGYRRDAALLYALRSKIADEIEAFDRFPAVVISVPWENAVTEKSTVELKIFAPRGTTVRINGKKMAVGISKSSQIFPVELSQIGENRLKIELFNGARHATFYRKYTRKPDPKLQTLNDLIRRADACGLTPNTARQFARQARGGQYTAADQKRASRLISQLNTALLAENFRQVAHYRSPLAQVLYRWAQQLYQQGNRSRAAQYLELIRATQNFKSGAQQKVKMTFDATSRPGAFLLDNGKIQVRIAETDGSIMALKVNQRECLPATKAGGYRDELTKGTQSSTQVSPRVQLVEVLPERVTLAWDAQLNNTPFVYRKLLTVYATSALVEITYEISNIMPRNIISDDPEHYEINWSALATVMGDKVLLATERGQKTQILSADSTRLKLQKPGDWPLSRPVIGVYHSATRTGLMLQGDHEITHGFGDVDAVSHPSDATWHLGFRRIRTQSLRSNRPGNQPFAVLPGESRTFKVKLHGFSQVTDEAEFQRQMDYRLK